MTESELQNMAIYKQFRLYNKRIGQRSGGQKSVSVSRKVDNSHGLETGKLGRKYRKTLQKFSGKITEFFGLRSADSVLYLYVNSWTKFPKNDSSVLPDLDYF